MIAQDAIVTVDKWEVREMAALSPEKIDALWGMLQKYRTLFSDLTIDDKANFIQAIIAPHTMWFEVVEHDVIVGIVWFSDMYQVTDCTGHMVFFDRLPAEKLRLCKGLVKWMFVQFPLQRMTVTPPEIYFATIRLLLKIGLKYEGRKRQAVLLGGKWNDQMIYGILRSEVEAL